MQSDLEEGEIPDFDVPPSVSARNKRGMILGSRRLHSLGSLNAHDKFKKRSRRYDSSPSEDEYMYEEENLARKNRLLHKHLCKNHLMGIAPKHLHPIQPSYGSVEVIMTKIGESLGRHSDYYYKERRSKEPRYVVAINDSHTIKSVLRKTSPVFKRLEYNYCNKRRHSEANSESVNNIREKYGKIKRKKSFDARRSKKRKRKHSEIYERGTDKVDKFKKLRLFEQKEKGRSERNRKPKKHGLGPKLFKETPLPPEQEPQYQPQENNVKEKPNLEDLNYSLDDPKDSPSHTAGESSVDDPPSIVSDGSSAEINSTQKPEQINIEDDDDDEEDLVKLRLLALTSNKKKSQGLANNGLGTVKDLEKSSEEKANIESKSNEADYEKTRDSPSSSNDETVKKSGSDNEIDRYELYLRAEALKTALLKKHQRILKKRKNFSAISRNKEVTKGEDSNGENLVKKNEMDIDIISDEELLEKNLEGDSGARLVVAENCEKSEIEDANKTDSESGKEGKAIDIHEEHELQSENGVIVVGTDHSETSSISAESGTPESGNIADTDVEDTPAGPQSAKKKTKRIRQKQSKLSDLSETNVNTNSVLSLGSATVENKNVFNSTKLGYSQSSIDNNKSHPEKKFFSVDTVASSNVEVNAAPCNISNSQSCFDSKQNYNKNITTQKAVGLANEEPAAKIPESERIIVHLGSDSSDEEFPPGTEPDEISSTVLKVESEKIPPPVSVINETDLKEFEKSVELLLSGARRKIERSAQLRSQVPPTPEAVYSHLAPSQRLEYMRLKQKIAEREKLGKAGKINLKKPSMAETNKHRANSTEDKIISPTNAPKNIGKRPTFSQNVGDNNGAVNFKNRITPKEVGNPLVKNNAIHTPNYASPGTSTSARISQFSKIQKPTPQPNSQRESANTPKRDLTDSNSKNAIRKAPAEFIIERKRMLNQNRLHLERLKILWKNIKIEKMVEAKYEREIKKLKNQQSIFEMKINHQRIKIKRMADESQKIYEAFQRNNKKVEVYSKRRKIGPKAENESQKAQDQDKATTKRNDGKGKDVRKDVAGDMEIVKDIEKGRAVGKDFEKDLGVTKDIEKNEEIGKGIEKDMEVGKDVEEDMEVAKGIEKNEEIEKGIEEDMEVGKDVAGDMEIVKDIEKHEEIGKGIEKDMEVGKDVEEDTEVGKDVEEDMEVTKDIEKNEEIGKGIEKDMEVGKGIEKDMEVGKDVAKEVIPDEVENYMRLIAEDTQIGVVEKRQETETKAEEKESDAKETLTVIDKDLLKEYKSPLENIANGSESSGCRRIDPNIIMCQYDLLGKCNDEECVFQHWRA